MIGTVLGSYRIIEAREDGRFGPVYRAIDLNQDREVAIQQLAPALIQDESRLARLRAEAITLARLRHPNIARFYGLLEDDGGDFLVTEYVAGESFQSLILRRGALPLPDALELLCQALSGLCQAHAQSVIHGLITSSNLMRDAEGVVKITDCGIARALGLTCPSGAERFSASLAYLAPEQREGLEPGARSDIYSLGRVLSELVTGQAASNGATGVGVALPPAEMVRSPAPERTPDWPEGVERAIQRALQEDPDARFATAGEFRRALERALQPPVTEPVPIEPEAVWRRSAAGDRPWRRRAFAAASAFGVVALAVLLTWSRPAARPALTPRKAPARQPAAVETLDLERETLTAPPPLVESARMKTARLNAVEQRRDGAPGLQPAALRVPIASNRVTQVAQPGDPSVRSTPVPRLVGLRLAVAESIARSAGFRLIIARPAPDPRPKGSVIAQRPPSGARRWGQHPAIWVTPSSGASRVRLPNLVGERLPQARALARAKGVTIIVRGTVASSLPEGAVARQKPAPGSLIRRPGGQIRVRLSAGPPRFPAPAARPLSRAVPDDRIRVPALVGLTIKQARQRARQGGYWLVFHGVGPHRARPGTVVWQDPPAGAQPGGGRFIGYRVSDGPP